jgi:hypothetical protein
VSFRRELFTLAQVANKSYRESSNLARTPLVNEFSTAKSKS